MRDRNGFRYVLSTAVFFVVLGAATPCKALVMSEIMYHPADEGEVLEFIELYNNRTVSEELGGWGFVDGVEYTFPEGTLLGPKQYLVVARDPAALAAAYGTQGAYGPFVGRLGNDGERVALANELGEVFLSARYRDDHPWPVAPDGTGHSLILSKLGGDPDSATSWSASSRLGGTPGGPDEVQAEPEEPTLATLVDVGHAGRYFKGFREPSPGPAGPTTSWTQIEFNDNPATTQWLAGPSGYGYSSDAAELQSVRTVLNDMNGSYQSIYARLRLALTQDQIDTFSQLRAEVYYDDGFVLYLNGTRVGDSGQLPGDPPPFDQGVSSATDYAPASVDLTGYLNLLAPGTNVLAVQGHNASLSGSSDCIISPILRAVIAAPEQEQDDPRARLLINEILANSDAEPGIDRIELYNPGPVEVDLSHVYLSDDPADLLKYKGPDGLVLEPGEFWTTGADLPFGLDSAGETVYVTMTENNAAPKPVRVMDAVRYGAMEAEVSFGRYPDGARAFSFLTLATFGASNSRPTIDAIVINEIMYHHPTEDERFEFVELYNRGTAMVPLAGWAFTDGIEYTFGAGIELPPNAYLVVAKDPNFLAAVYENLTAGANLLGPYAGNLDNGCERVRLSRPLTQADEDVNATEPPMVTVDEVTYSDGGLWPSWADGEGASLELCDPSSNNDTPAAWADSDETSKTSWQQFSFAINGNDSQYTHDTITIFDMMLLSRGEVLLDDLELLVDGVNRLNNGGFEAGEASWRILGNHVRSFATAQDRHSGAQALHLIATGHGDPGANRINQSISSIRANTVTFRGWTRWVRGSRFLLMRTARERAPVQPPRPAHSFELSAPLNIGTPGLQNTAFVANRGPDIVDVRHAPVLPAAGEPIVVTARITDDDGVIAAMLAFQSEGQADQDAAYLVDDGTGDDAIAGDGVYTATIPGAAGGTMRSFYLTAFDGAIITRFPTTDPTADVPNRTCLVRVGDAQLSTQFATYRIWLSDATINVFRSRTNLSNELTDCTFVYNDTEVFYNVGFRLRGSPWLRPGSGWDPRDRHAYRLEFNPDQKFRDRTEINLDMTEGSGRGPLQERACYWFHRQLGLHFSMQEFVRPILNGRVYGDYEDVQKVDGDYIENWFPDDPDGYLYEIDDYFEFDAAGTQHTNLQEGLKYDSRHPLIKETYRWGIEKRSHRENDDWDLLFDFAVAMNTPSNHPNYEAIIESVIHPKQFAAMLALRHAVGDWDSYGYRRGKNNSFYFAPNEGKWYLLPWDIDFCLGSGDGASTSLFYIDSNQFPEVISFVNNPKFRQMYLQAYADLVHGPWQTSYGTANPPTAFDRFLDEAADALVADGLADGRRNSIKSFVRSRRDYILSQLPANMR
ncbi:MAG: lamin tail domain-containing protein [Sedimentisphaerales bacterium]|nr:lamin tail domain-containing protein [Sedimentisphaerales bacterium]